MRQYLSDDSTWQNAVVVVASIYCPYCGATLNVAFAANNGASDRQLLTTTIVSFGSAYLGSEGSGFSKPVSIFGTAALQIGGVLAAGGGGNRGHAILAAAFSSVAQFGIYSAGLGTTSAFIAQTLTSGTAAYIGDGKFANGALSVMESWAIRSAPETLDTAVEVVSAALYEFTQPPQESSTSSSGFTIAQADSSGGEALPGIGPIPLADGRPLAQAISGFWESLKTAYSNILWRSKYRERALEAARIDPKSAEAKNLQVHHIVARNAWAAEPGRVVLRDVGIDVDSLDNLAIMWKPDHEGLHSPLYYDTVNAAVDAGKAAAGFYGVKGALGVIRLQLETLGTYP